MSSLLHLLKLPVELRQQVFCTIIYSRYPIEIGKKSSDIHIVPDNKERTSSKRGNSKRFHIVDLKPEFGGPFEALSLTCKQLRNEIMEWLQTEQKNCSDIVLTKAFGVLHANLISFRLSFTPGEPAFGGTLEHIGGIGGEISQLDVHHQAEFYGLWRDVIVQGGTNDIYEATKRIKWRLQDHGWRERECLRAVWDGCPDARLHTRGQQMVPNLEWENWDILVPDSFLTTEAIGDEGVLVLGKRWFQGKDLN